MSPSVCAKGARVLAAVAVAMGVRVAVIVATAHAHPFEKVVRVALRREQERAPGDVDEAMVVMERVLESVRHVPAQDGVRQVDVGEQHERDARHAPQADERPLMLEPVGEDCAAAYRRDEPDGDGVRGLVDPRRETSRREAGEWKERE